MHVVHVPLRTKMATLGENYLVEIMHCRVLNIVGVNWLVPLKLRVSWVDREPWIIDFSCAGILWKFSWKLNLFQYSELQLKFGNKRIIGEPCYKCSSQLEPPCCGHYIDQSWHSHVCSLGYPRRKNLDFILLWPLTRKCTLQLSICTAENHFALFPSVCHLVVVRF